MKNNKSEKRLMGVIAKEIIAQDKLSRLLWRQFLLGIAYGLGASLGAAAVLAVSVYIYRNFLFVIIDRLF